MSSNSGNPNFTYAVKGEVEGSNKGTLPAGLPRAAHDPLARCLQQGGARVALGGGKSPQVLSHQAFPPAAAVVQGVGGRQAAHQRLRIVLSAV